MRTARCVLACAFVIANTGAGIAQTQAPSTPPPAGCATGTADRLAAKNDTAAHAFLDGVQKAVGSGDHEQVAALVRFPLRVNGLKPATVSEKVFLKRYDEIMTQAVKDAVLDNRKSQDCLFHNYQGYMVGDGSVWFDRVRKQDFRIVTINLPTPK